MNFVSRTDFIFFISENEISERTIVAYGKLFTAALDILILRYLLGHSSGKVNWSNG